MKVYESSHPKKRDYTRVPQIKIMPKASLWEKPET